MAKIDSMSIVAAAIQVVGVAGCVIALREFTPLPFWACFALAFPLFIALFWAVVAIVHIYPHLKNAPSTPPHPFPTPEGSRDKKLPQDPFSFTYPAGLHISQSLPEVSLKEFSGVTIRDMGTGYVWYDLPSFKYTLGEIFISLVYYGGSLCEILIWLEFTDSDESPGQSPEREHRRVAGIGAWLTSIGYPPARYPWGVIWSCLDPKTAVGRGGVEYKQASTCGSAQFLKSSHY
jgi:hypothetical protein